MKLANLKWQSREVGELKYKAINLGDNLQLMAIDYLYENMNIKKSDIVYLNLEELPSYDGEEVILPLCWSFFDPHWMVENYIKISEKIRPVFLAMTLGATYQAKYLNEENLNYLKRFEPIGCRDMETKRILLENGVKAYMNGCLTSLFPKRETKGGNKVFFIDAPVELNDYIPEEYRKNAEFLTQQYYFPADVSIEEINCFVKKHYLKISEEAKLVVTSRLHVASPCMAFGIPVILAKKEIDGRFGWLEKYLPLYCQNDYREINWHPEAPDYEEAKQTIIQYNCDRIIGEWKQWRSIDEMNQYFNIDEKKYINFAKLLGNGEEQIKAFLHENWSTDTIYEYAIWGATAAAAEVIEYIKTEYPQTKLMMVVDKYKSGEFCGAEIVRPEHLVENVPQYLFVLPVMASNEAYELCKKIGMAENHCCIFGDVFLKENEFK